MLVQGGRRWAFVEAGGFHTCGITTDDKAFCWGDNSRGALGNNSASDRLVPVQVAGTRRYRRVSAGVHFSGAMSLADKAFCWGENHWGQLGMGTATTKMRRTANTRRRRRSPVG